jgi:hypothetical protein
VNLLFVDPTLGCATPMIARLPKAALGVLVVGEAPNYADTFDPDKATWRTTTTPTPPDGGGASKRAREAVKKINPTYVPQAFVYCNRGAFQDEDWVLRVKKSRTGVLMAPEWVYVESVVLVDKKDRYYEDQYPYQAVQARESRHCPAPPFLIDASFRSALRRAAIEFGPSRIAAQLESKPPTPAFLQRIREALWSFNAPENCPGAAREC